MTEHLSFTYDPTGYMLTYKGKPIGGAGTKAPSTHWRHRRADLKMYREAAQRELSHLAAGRGQARFLKAIDIIEGRN